MFSEDVQIVRPDLESTVPLLEMRGITKSYGGIRVLDDVSFECRAGEVHGLVGENGAGKSTLMRILAGAAAADAGEIRLGGEQVHLRDPRDALARGIGIVYQEFTLVPNLSVAENLFLGQEPTRRLGLLDRGRLESDSRRLLERTRLPISPGSPIHRLAVEQQQKLEIAKTLVVPLRILVFDEPTAALGQHETEELFELIGKLREDGVTVVYISHRLDELFRVAERVTVLKDGRRVVTVPCASVTRTDLIRYMVGREVSSLFPARSRPPGDVQLDVVDLARDGAFTGVSFSARAGQIVGVAGLAGSGRTELGRVLAGLARPTSGQLRLGGKPVSFRGPRDAIRRGVILSPQDRKAEGLALDRPAHENLTLASLSRLARAVWLAPSRLRRFAVDAAGRVGLPVAFLVREARQLSGGNQQKVMLGRALATQPRLLVLDEPTRGVDVGAKADIYRLIRRQADSGAAVVVISSELVEIVGLSDVVVVMRRGSPPAVLEEGISEESILRAAFDVGASSETAVAAARVRPAKRFALPRMRLDEAFMPVAALVVLFVTAALMSGDFLQTTNLENLGPQAVPLGLLALGQMVVILTGGIDLSVGSAVTISNLVSAEILARVHSGGWVAFPASVALGVAIGSVNAGLVLLRMPPFLATFAMLSILQGAAFVIFPASVGPVPQSFWKVAAGKIGPVSWATAVLVVLFLLTWVVLARTRLGRHLFALGADPVATRSRGVRTNRLLVLVYAFSGVCAALAGVYLTARIGGGLPSSGQGMELDAIAAVVVGGASLYGGRATVLGTAAGVAILSVIDDVFNLVGVNTFYQEIFKGGIILAVAAAWVIGNRKTLPASA